MLNLVIVGNVFISSFQAQFEKSKLNIRLLDKFIIVIYLRSVKYGIHYILLALNIN